MGVKGRLMKQGICLHTVYLHCCTPDTNHTYPGSENRVEWTKLIDIIQIIKSLYILFGKILKM